MAETYHAELLEHLEAKQRAVNTQIDSTYELIRNGDKYKEDDLDAIVAEIQSGDAGCAICQAYQGRAGA